MNVIAEWAAAAMTRRVLAGLISALVVAVLFQAFVGFLIATGADTRALQRLRRSTMRPRAP